MICHILHFQSNLPNAYQSRVTIHALPLQFMGLSCRLNSNVSYQKSWPGPSRSSTDLVVSFFFNELDHIIRQKPNTGNIYGVLLSWTVSRRNSGLDEFYCLRQTILLKIDGMSKIQDCVQERGQLLVLGSIVLRDIQSLSMKFCWLHR